MSFEGLVYLNSTQLSNIIKQGKHRNVDKLKLIIHCYYPILLITIKVKTDIKVAFFFIHL